MPSKIDIQTTITYGHIENAKSRVTQHIGGTRSGKTYAILQWLLVQMQPINSDLHLMNNLPPHAMVHNHLSQDNN